MKRISWLTGTVRQWSALWPAPTALALGVVAALGVAEIALRTADALGLIKDWEDTRAARRMSIWTMSGNPDLVFQHRPNYVKDGVRFTEKQGILRPTDVDERPAPGRFRIAALGDSVGAALKLPYEERMFTRLENDLSKDGFPVEVLNFCVNGYSTLQEAALLRDLASRFSPDLVLLQYCVNDFYPTEFPTHWFQEQWRSYAIEFLGHSLDRSILRGYPTAEYWDKLYRTDAKGWAAVDRGFREITTYCQARRIPALLVIAPAISHGGWDEGNAVGRHTAVAERARAAGFHVLDLLPVFRQYPVESLRFEPWDTFHTNSLGHRIAADAMASAVKEIGLPSAVRRDIMSER